jgi:hypothetical protein
LPKNTVDALAVSDNSVFVGIGAGFGVYRSADNGLSWAAANTGMSFSTVSAFAVSGSNIFAGTENGVFLSTDNGSSWNAARADLPTNARVGGFAVIGENILAAMSAVSGGGAYLSTNNGSSWTAFNSGLPNVDSNSVLTITDLAACSTDILAATYGGGVWRRPLSDMVGSSSPPP